MIGAAGSTLVTGAGGLTAQWPRRPKKTSAAIAGMASHKILSWAAARRRFGRGLNIVQASFRDFVAANPSIERRAGQRGIIAKTFVTCSRFV